MRPASRSRARSASGTPAGKLRKGSVENARGGIVHDVGAEGAVVAVEDGARQGEAGAHALAQERDLLAHVSRHGAQARDVVFVVADGRQRHLARELGELGVEAAVGVPGHPPRAELALRHRVEHLALEHVAIDAIVGGEGGAIDRAEAIEGRAPEAVTALEVVTGHGRKPVVEATVAHGSGEEGILSQPELPRLGHDRGQPCPGVGRRGRLRGREDQDGGDCGEHGHLRERAGVKRGTGSSGRTVRSRGARPAAACTRGTSTSRS